MKKRQLKPDFQRIKNKMSKLVRLHGGRCTDDSHRGPGIHTTYELANVKIGYTWHLSPSDSRFGVKKCISDLRRVLTKLGLQEHRNEIICMMPSSELYQLEQDLFYQIAILEAPCPPIERAA